MIKLYSQLIENKVKSIALIVAVLSIILGAVWQTQAISSQGATIGTASDGSYVKRCYDRERSATQNITPLDTRPRGITAILANPTGETSTSVSQSRAT